jgi:tyrosyl-tRNA synthetase
MRSQALLDELKWRDLLFQHTEQVGTALGTGQLTGYVGFDPTAPSLHVGSLVPVMGLVHLQRAGHRPIALVGGGTGMIGDPSGKSTERQLSDAGVVAANAAAIHRQLERFLDFSGTTAARMVDNAEWLLELRAVDFMRDVGKHFTVNVMLQKESVKARMEAGISFTEFSYMLLQAYDFLELSRRYGTSLQMGGSDQWGNITAGIELIRRTVSKEAHGITFPLVATAAGTKFGKTEAGAVWLDPTMTSPYKFYQFWINADDRDVRRYLRFFTLLPREEIESLEAAMAAHPEKREAQRALAHEVTSRVHGPDGVKGVEDATQILFGGSLSGLDERPFHVLKNEIPFYKSPTVTTAGDVIGVVTGEKDLFKSRGDAKRMVQQGGVYINGQRIAAEDEPVSVLYGKYILVRKGSKNYALIEKT